MPTQRLAVQKLHPRSARLAGGVISIVVVCGGLLAGGGCQRESAQPERAAHREPANRPADLSAAFRQLQALRVQAAAASEAGTSGESTAATPWPAIRARLAETAEWLPELAADSDLDEQGWQQVQTAAAAFTTRLEQLGTAATPPTAAAWKALDLAGLLQQLEPWLASADRARSHPLAPLAGSQLP